MKSEDREALAGIAELQWGLLTARQAEAAGVTRMQLSRLVASGGLLRVIHGVYRIAGAPESDHEEVLAAWLSLGGAERPDEGGVAAVVAAGTTAAALHGVGNYFLDGLDFITPARRATRLEGVRLRTRQLTADQVTIADGVPALTIEETAADILALTGDTSNVALLLADGIRRGMVSRAALERALGPSAKTSGFAGGAEFAADLLELAGAAPEDLNG